MIEIDLPEAAKWYAKAAAAGHVRAMTRLGSPSPVGKRSEERPAGAQLFSRSGRVGQSRGHEVPGDLFRAGTRLVKDRYRAARVVSQIGRSRAPERAC